jgi:hypothetical protein
MTLPGHPLDRCKLRPLGQIGPPELGSRVLGAYQQGHVAEPVAAGPDHHRGTRAEEAAVLTATRTSSPETSRNMTG